MEIPRVIRGLQVREPTIVCLTSADMNASGIYFDCPVSSVVNARPHTYLATLSLLPNAVICIVNSLLASPGTHQLGVARVQATQKLPWPA